MTVEQTDIDRVTASLDRVAAARAWLDEFHGEDDGAVRIALAGDGYGWDELRPIRRDTGPLLGKGLTHAAMLDGLALGIVVEADRHADVYACPYRHDGPRRLGGAVARRHVHADIDGALDDARVRALGAMVVASGSLTPDGQPHGHVYLRLTGDVTPRAHKALCTALGTAVGGDDADATKVGDADVLRVPGTLNFKRGTGGDARPVTWLVRPDDPAVRTWEARDLAEALGVTWPIPPAEPRPEPSSSDQRDEQHGDLRPLGNAGARLAGLVRSVSAAPRGAGNGRLYSAARLAGAICARDGSDAPPGEDVRRDLLDAYLARPGPHTLTAEERRDKGEDTAFRAWHLGEADPAAAGTPYDYRLPEDENGDGDEIEESVHVTIDLRDLPEIADPELEAEQMTADERTRTRFPLLDLAALVDPARPPRRWLWQDIVPEGEHVSIVAPAGEGKSLLMLALAQHLATGCGTFLGRVLDLPVERRVFYVDMENSEDDFAERLVALGVDPDNVAALAERLLVLHLPPLPGLDTAPGAYQLERLLDAYGAGAGDVLVLDSTQRLTEGEENSNDTMRALYNRTSLVLKRRGLTVLRTDNTGHEGSRARGASAKRDDVGMSWLLAPDPRLPGVYALASAKRRAAPNGTSGSGALTFRRVTGEDGRLTFAPTAGSTFGDVMADTRALLDRLGVPLDAGQNAAWDAVAEEQERAEAAGEEQVREMSRRVVREAQSERQMRLVVVVQDADGDHENGAGRGVKK